MMSLRRVNFVGAVLIALVLVVVGAHTPLAGQSEAAIGSDLFERRCGGCHALEHEKEGPRLGGVYGRKAGSVQSFQYSDALKKSGIEWNDESLNKWLTDPAQLVPNNDMAFRVPNANERREIIAFLKQHSGGQH